MQEVARKFEAEYIKDSEGLNVKTPTVRPRATEHIGEIIKIVKDLVESQAPTLPTTAMSTSALSP